jgi:hypothetical protein
MERVTDLADPRRCKGSCPVGQCPNLAEEGSDYCLAHGGVNRAPARHMRQYLLTRAQSQARLAALDDDEGLKTLRDEVVIATEMLERRLNLAQSDVDFIEAFPQIEKFIKMISDLKKSRQALDDKSGSMLSRVTVIRLAQRICELIVDRLEGIPNYEQTVDDLIGKIMTTIKNAVNSPSEAAMPS